MIAFLSLLLHVVVSPFKTRARLEAEIIMLRHQLNVMRRRFPSNPKLVVADRLLFVWLYLSLLKSSRDHGIGLPTKTAAEDSRLIELSVSCCCDTAT